MRTAEPSDPPVRPMAGALVAVAGLKGGCGRTTLAVGLLGALVAAGYRALLLDADRAGAASGWLGRGPLAAAVRTRPIAAPAALRSWLEELQAARAAAELVLLDLPSADPVPLVAAALASDLVLLPVAPTDLELEAARSTLGWLERARARRGHDLPRLAVVPSRLAVLNPAARDHEDRLAPLGVALTPPLRLRPGHERGFAQGLPVGRLAPGSPEDLELRAIARWLVRALGLADRLGGPPAAAAGPAGAAPVRAGYLAEPPGARGALDLSAYTRRLRDRLLPRAWRRG
jgi:chromosome partitioning protein